MTGGADRRKILELKANLTVNLTFPARSRDGELVRVTVPETVGRPGSISGWTHSDSGGRHRVVEDERLEVQPQLADISRGLQNEE